MENLTGCLICGKPLEYFTHTKKLECAICGGIYETNAACEDGHFICDECHSHEAFNFIISYALKSEHRNPFKIADEVMKNKLVKMHGPEHHYLVTAALLTAYKNSGGDIDLEECLKTAFQRTKDVPGGICGLWGSCGAGICSGIFISIITKATPLSEEEWSLANMMTSLSLNDISQNGGPRCCKRDTYLALNRAAVFVKEHFSIEMETPDSIYCGFYPNNKQCKKESCLFYSKTIS